MDFYTPMHFASFHGRKEGLTMAKIDSAYAYYMSTYANTEVSRYESHKKSDLRKIYNKIVKTNKESPLYKISDMDSAKKFAIDIKENAKSIQNVVASLSEGTESFDNTFQKKVASSSNEDAVIAKYVGNNSPEEQIEPFSISVEKLASPQNNTGNFIDNEALSLIPGSYAFDLNTNSSSYELQFTVNQGENNLDLLNKLNNLFKNSNLGIDSEIINDGEASALSLTSRQTGLSDEENYLFSISPTATPESIYAMNVLGINNITTPASNSEFHLNGTVHSSLSNTFTINNTFELTLNSTTDGDDATIGFKTNTDAVADNIQTLVNSYNSMLQTAQRHDESGSGSGHKLVSDLQSLTNNKKAELEYIGLMLSDDGTLSIDKDILSSAIEPNRVDSTFETLSNFKKLIGEKADNISINPMNYVNKVVVAYKNPGHNFNTPYISSIYSGMMMDDYI